MVHICMALTQVPCIHTLTCTKPYENLSYVYDFGYRMVGLIAHFIQLVNIQGCVLKIANAPVQTHATD